VRAIRSLSSGDWHTIAVAGDGNYVAWGDNGFGQIGDGTTTTALTGKYVANATPTIVAAVGGTGHSCSLHADSSVRCWGANFSGQLGDGTITQRFSPVKVQGLSVAVKQLVAGENHNCALLVNGQVYCWGTDREGELGDLAGQDRWLPVPVSFGAETALSIASGAQHTCALTSGPGLWCWGMNDEGQIGDGSNYYAFGPTKVMLQ
jgi:alpha-tubulin suppressor-like RCC1 family protein